MPSEDRLGAWQLHLQEQTLPQHLHPARSLPGPWVPVLEPSPGQGQGVAAPPTRSTRPAPEPLLAPHLQTLPTHNTFSAQHMRCGSCLAWLGMTQAPTHGTAYVMRWCETPPL